MPRKRTTPALFHTAIVAAMTFWLAACGSTPSQYHKTTTPDFTTSVRNHLNAVESRDFDTFKSTLTQTDDLYVIFPGGGLLENTQAVLDFHREWFTDKAWIFKTEIVKTIEGTDQSTALVKYSFQDNPDQPPRHAWLVLTFQIEDNSWRLIHDQNTRID